MSHMAAVFARQSDHSSFDEGADACDLPQNRLAPRHEPVFIRFFDYHYWTVLLRANKSNKNMRRDNIYLT